MRRELFVLPERLAVCRMPEAGPPPPWVFYQDTRIFSVTRAPGEISVVCAEDDVPPSMTRVEPGWRAIGLRGPIPFSETGVLASVIQPLASAGVPVFALSTFDTDYVLVREADLARAIQTLSADFEIVEGPPR
ncbi:MAG TPA: ACT domain-containing protein [Candidatus Udaeobacter sp.]|jgi:hypothetical protein|nr:ACT domain-containing protein [Candidatus Udaeobacter sp.]